MGWISETTRAAPIGRADEGAIDSVQTASALCSFTLKGAVVSDTSHHHKNGGTEKQESYSTEQVWC